MPSTLIEVIRRYSADEEVAIIDAVHDALVSAFEIPRGDKHDRLVSHDPHRFSHSPTLTQPEFYMFVAIDCIAGRSIEAKRNLYREIVDGLSASGIPPDHVTIVVRESAAGNWGVRGGQAACNVDLGFQRQCVTSKLAAPHRADYAGRGNLRRDRPDRGS